MSKIFAGLLKLCISGLLALLVLNGFVMIYNYSGIHIENTTGATDYKWESYQIKSNMTEGFSCFAMDKDGFNNDTMYEHVDILLMGGSHTEGVNVGKYKNYGYLLNKKSGLNVYNIGMSGHTLYTCLKNAQNAYKEYVPSKYLIIETDSVELSIDEMNAVINKEYKTIPSYDEGILYVLQKYCPVIKSIYKQVDLWKSNAYSDEKVREVTEVYDSNYYLTLEKMLNKSLEGITCNIVILFHPRMHIDKTGKLIIDTDKDAVDLFETCCEKNNIDFINVEAEVLEGYYKEHKLINGFTNTSPGEGHLNSYGHKILADTLAEYINTAEEIK